MKSIRFRFRRRSAVAAAAVVAIATATVVVVVTQDAQAFTSPVGMEQRSEWKPTGWRSEREQTRCPVDTLIVGVKVEPVQGLASGTNHVQCAQPVVSADRNVLVMPTGTPTKSAWIDESDPAPATFDCGDAPMIATTHLGTYTKGETQYRCAALRAEASSLGAPATVGVVSSSWSGWMDSAHWADGALQTSFEYVCPSGSALSGREHAHDQYGKVRFRCTTWEVRS